MSNRLLTGRKEGFESPGAHQYNTGMPITCWRCQKTSHNPNDVIQRWCGFCKDVIPMMKQEPVEQLGMPLIRWTHESCVAHFAVGEADGHRYATLYDIRSREEGRGHATHLLSAAKEQYEREGRRFGGTVALNDRMHKIYKRLGITEYGADDDGE